ncbi:MAG: ATP-binding protein, partial [Kangiella sp.]|nr:ATP-binding protein [Kangiella sp.]
MTDMVTHIRARISADALDKATRFFNAGLEDIFNELLKKARRAGATRVEIIEEPDQIIVSDD